MTPFVFTMFAYAAFVGVGLYFIVKQYRWSKAYKIKIKASYDKLIKECEEYEEYQKTKAEKYKDITS